jgi:CubicO group peptidase (beta-lactamase class C family)
MKKLTLFLLFASLPMVALCQENSNKNFAYADSVMSANYKPDAPGAVLLIARNGYPVFEKAYGMANMGLKIPNRIGYNFEIGSNTKQFTAVAILQLVQKGELSLQDDLHKYLPRYNTHGQHITIENLLTHTSGIPSYTEEPNFNWRDNINISKDSLMMRVSQDSLLFKPGTNWSYSNTGFFLLGMVIEKITGMTYADYIQKNILDPLHMNHTYVGIGNKIIPNLVTGYAYVPGNGKYKDAIDIPFSEVFSAGDMISNVNDLLKWDNALYTDKLVNPRLLQKAWTSYTLKNGQKTGYGYGWLVTHYKNVGLIWHDGAVPGFLSAVIRLPRKHAYIALLSNTYKVNPQIPAMLIAFHTAGQPLTRPPAIKPNPALFKDYTGVYELQAMSGRLVSNSSSKKMHYYITRKEDTLFVQTTGGSPAPLVPIAKDEFISSGNSGDSLFMSLFTLYGEITERLKR